jgi:hypothetical protein
VRTLLVLALLIPVTRAEPGAAVAWRLPATELVRYELREAGKKKGSIVTVQRHDLRAKGQYLPVSLARSDLPVLFALQLPPPDTAKLTLEVRKVVPLRAKGLLEIRTPDEATAEVVATWSFFSRGREEKGFDFRIRDGTAGVRTVFDRKQGHVRSARIEIAYTLKKIKPKEGEEPSKISKVYELELKERGPVLYKGLQKDINAAIDRGVKHLKGLAQEDGSYKPHGKYDVGTTALGMLTLSACGVPRTDPVVEAGLKYIFARSPKKNYERAVALMAIEHAYTPPGEAHRKGGAAELRWDLRRAWCARIAAALERDALGPGAWAYKAHPGGRSIVHPDSSNTQYAVLGLRAAARMGIPVKVQTWEGVVRYFGQVRERNAPRATVSLVREGTVQPTEHRVRAAAGFRYKTARPHAWASMTCAGIASLAIAREQLQHRKKLSPKLATHIGHLILGGWAWLDRHWAMDRHALHPRGTWYHYYLYSLERAAILDAVKRVGGKDWYREGAAQLLARQKKSGSWDDKEKEQITKTCFALLFLKRATAPIVLTR